jgi:hypothetical protein
MKLKVFVGWDSRGDVAQRGVRHSILSPIDPNQVEVTPLNQPELGKQGSCNRDFADTWLKELESDCREMMRKTAA